MTYPSVILADTPLAYWQLNDTSGTAAADSSPNDLPGVYAGGITLAAVPSPIEGDTAEYVTLDGSTGYINLGDPTGLQIPSSAEGFTAEAWVKSSYTANHQVLWGVTAGYWQLLIAKTSGLPIFQSPTAGFGTTGSGSVADGAWHHLVGTWDQASALQKLYVDGALAATTPAASPPANGTGAQALGRQGATSNYYVRGSVAHCALYGAALTAAQVAAHYQAAHPIPGDGLTVMYWNGSEFVQAADGATTTRPASGVVIWEAMGSGETPVGVMVYDILIP